MPARSSAAKACPMYAGKIMKFLISKMKTPDLASEWMNKLYSLMYSPQDILIIQQHINTLQPITQEKLHSLVLSLINDKQETIKTHLSILKLTVSETETFEQLYTEFMKQSYEMFTNTKIDKQAYTVAFGGGRKRMKGGMIIELILLYIGYKLLIMCMIGFKGGIQTAVRFIEYLENCTNPIYQQKMLSQSMRHGLPVTEVLKYIKNLSAANLYESDALLTAIQYSKKYELADYTEILTKLFEKNPNPMLTFKILDEIVDNNDITALHFIIERKKLYLPRVHHCMSKFVMNYIHGKDIHTGIIATLLQYYKTVKEVQKVMIDIPESVTSRSRRLYSPMFIWHLIARYPIKEKYFMELFIEQDINFVDKNGMTLLMHAVDNLNVELCEFLLSQEKFRLIDARDKKGHTALMYVLQGGISLLPIVRLLIDNNAELKPEDTAIIKDEQMRFELQKIVDAKRLRVVKMHETILNKTSLPPDIVERISTLSMKVPKTIPPPPPSSRSRSR
jgi:hypothetical protein